MRDPRARRCPPAALTTDELDEILAAALDDVQPLPADGPDRVRVRRPARPPAAPGAPARPLLHVERTGSRISGWRGDLPPRELAALGGESAPIEATLDLHGLSLERAEERLDSFLTTARRRGTRTVLVVTGHGRDRPTPAVLHLAVPGWLAAPPLARLVHSFATARPEHGGHGALYVRLAKARS
ncbi:MAG: Smr/MutS family protein [Holophagales bacterium]|nr:MAG: Smr/MutS family protein [Holophagales bacterium]